MPGVLLLAFPAIRRDLTNQLATGNKCLNTWVPAFASGALFATVVLLILPATPPIIDKELQSGDGDGGHFEEGDVHD